MGKEPVVLLRQDGLESQGVGCRLELNIIFEIEIQAEWEEMSWRMSERFVIGRGLSVLGLDKGGRCY